jgi:hypothetical protein
MSPECVCPRDAAGEIEMQPHCPEHGAIDAEFIEAHQAHDHADPVSGAVMELAHEALNRQPTRLERIVCAVAPGYVCTPNVTPESLVDYAHRLLRAIEIRESDPDFNKHG